MSKIQAITPPRKGFTLAEVLVTLAIVGVLASMTIPTLLQNLNDAQYKTAYKKSFADLSQAIYTLTNDNGGSLKGTYADSNTFRQAMMSKMNYVKECTQSPYNNGCAAVADLNYLDGTKSTNWYTDSLNSAIVLNNGAILYPEMRSSTCTSTAIDSVTPICYSVLMDINGLKGPNILGKDIFSTGVQESALVPAGKNSTSIQCPSGNGADCAVKYLYN